MKIGIIQSSFIPWRGYFDFINSVDIFVFLEDVQFTRRDWRSRNKIKTKDGTNWLSVPIKYHTRGQSIYNTKIDYSQNWITKHKNSLFENYRHAPHIDTLFELYSIVDNKYLTISQLNRQLIKSICSYLEISTPLLNSIDFTKTGQKTEKLLNLTQSLGGSIYLSGPSADNYLNKELFISKGIDLEYKSYHYPAYPQLWGKFEDSLSILDTIANCGQNSKKYIQSDRPNQIIIKNKCFYEKT